ncbi:Nicotinamidase [Exaiptasia diaphana]|nr:Nicotinamidase [Exaiptasia diaphana]
MAYFGLDHFLVCPVKTARTTALLVVDVQNDFINGSLALKHCPAAEDGYEVISTINEILHQKLFNHVVYTLDWHPPDHCSFVDNVHKYPVHHSSPVTAKEAKVFETVVYSHPTVIQQRLWPVHCVEDTWGAALHEDLKAPDEEDYISKKGLEAHIDSYSAFWTSGHLHQSDLFKVLLRKGVTDVYIAGLAFDICARFTAIDAALHGFNTYVIEDACRGTCPHANSQTKDEFKKHGIALLNSKDLSDHFGHQVTESS